MKNAKLNKAKAAHGRETGAVIAAENVRRMTVVYRAIAACAALLLAAATPSTNVATQLRADLQAYLTSRASIEHISAVSLSVSLPDGRFIDVAAGTTEYGGGVPVTPSHLFQIGSNTKAFTGVLAVKLQAEHKLSIDDTLGRWLPQYSAWKSATIQQLLDMTTGIPTYDNTQSMQRALSRYPYRDFNAKQLVAYVDPKSPLKHEWLYSNTGYILTQMILEKATGESYAELLRNDVIAPSGIANIYYYPGIYPASLRARTVAGYFDNDEPENAGLAPLLGKNQRDYSLSWAQAAGGIVATPHAMAAWARQLYQGSIINDAQRARLESLVSMKTADPIADVTASNPRGFGLGLAKMSMPGLGSFWFYEGMTLGYRVVHAYFPKQNVVVAFGLNSQPRGDRNGSGQLVQSIVKTLKANGLFK
jgi:D-alanyl-D-alanine carboxypeptidase